MYSQPAETDPWSCRWEDYDYDYLERPDSKPNRFSFLGRGMSEDQIAGTADLSPYLNDPVLATLVEANGIH